MIPARYRQTARVKTRISVDRIVNCDAEPNQLEALI